MCNLTTINGTKVQTEEDLRKFVKAATIIGTLQATYTDFKFLDERDRKITEEEALLGVSILGGLSNPAILTDDAVLANNSSYAVEVNEIWAEKLGINPAARVTCIKPDGNSSCVLESPFSGIHPAHHRKYFRRQQVNTQDNVYKHFKAVNPELCEVLTYSSNGDEVIKFPIALNNDHGVIKDDISAVEHLDIIKKVQLNWVKGGEKNNKKPVSHSVSCTVLVGADEWDTIAQYLYDNRQYFTAVSLLARTGDKDYVQAPYEAIKTPEDYHEWNSTNYSLKPVDYSTMREESDYTTRSEELSCVGGVCSL
jgi:ribonucleoside-diphosphate reductase alpha chain